MIVIVLHAFACSAVIGAELQAFAYGLAWMHCNIVHGYTRLLVPDVHWRNAVSIASIEVNIVFVTIAATRVINAALEDAIKWLVCCRGSAISDAVLKAHAQVVSLTE